MGLFKRGYESVREEKARQEKARENSSKTLFRFFIKGDGEEAQVRFLTEDPVNFKEHTIPVGNRYENHVCTHDFGECELCNSGDRPSFKSAYLIFDKRGYTNKEGKEIKGSLKLYVQGTRVTSQLERLSQRYGLTTRDYIIERSGSGTSTTYMFDRLDEDELTKQEITAMLPEFLKSKYDGTMSSLYTIVEEQLEMMLGETPDSEERDAESEVVSLKDIEERSAKERPSMAKKLGKKKGLVKKK